MGCITAYSSISQATFPNAWNTAMAALNSVSPPFPNSDVVPDSPWIEMDQRDSAKAMVEYA